MHATQETGRIMQLHELQTEFARHVLGKQSNDLLPLIEINGIEASRRLQVYRNNFRITLTESLQSVYPVVEQLVGDAFFVQTVAQYIENHLPQTGDLREYGSDFPDFLENLESLGSLKYIPDIARIEWLCHLSWFAKDAETLSIQELSEIPEEEYPNLKLGFHPSVHTLESEHPVFDIWEYCMQDEANRSGSSLEIGSQGQCVLIRRDNYEVTVNRIDHTLFKFLKMMAENCSLVDAISAILHEYPDADPAKIVHSAFAHSTITELSLSRT